MDGSSRRNCGKQGGPILFRRRATTDAARLDQHLGHGTQGTRATDSHIDQAGDALGRREQPNRDTTCTATIHRQLLPGEQRTSMLEQCRAEA